jgi:hypothetical protein
MTTVEGSLNILWQNYPQPAAAPRYRLLFTRYVSPKGGAAQSRQAVGEDRLRSYLVGIDLTAQDAKCWIEQVHEKHTVTIPRVYMPDREIAAYE